MGENFTTNHTNHTNCREKRRGFGERVAVGRER